MNQAFRITTSSPATIVVSAKSAYVYAILIAIANDGAQDWKLRIQNGEADPDGPKVLVPAYTLYLEPPTGPAEPFRPPNPRQFDWTHAPKLMKNGIKIVKSPGTGTLDVSVWIDYETTEVSA